MVDNADNPNYEKAVMKVKKVKGFYEHLTSFILINIILVGINLLTSPDYLWFYWVTFIWGIWLVWHAIQTFVITDQFDNWEEKKIQKYMEKEEKKEK